MNVIKTSISAVLIFEPKIFGDEREYFMESFRDDIIKEYIGNVNFVQDNESYSQYGVLRGLHFQRPPYTQSKLVRVIQGEVLDIVVDIRLGSPTYGKHVSVKLSEEEKQACIFGYYVNDPERYGVAEFNEEGKVISIEDKPLKAKSNYAVVGLCFFPNSVIEVAKKIKPSERGELEITTVNEHYLSQNQLKMSLMGRGFTWLDTGTHQSLLEASNYIETIQNRQGLMVSCLEEIAWRKGWIDDKVLEDLAKQLDKNSYGKYLLRLLNS